MGPSSSPAPKSWWLFFGGVWGHVLAPQSVTFGVVWCGNTTSHPIFKNQIFDLVRGGTNPTLRACPTVHKHYPSTPCDHPKFKWSLALPALPPFGCNGWKHHRAALTGLVWVDPGNWLRGGENLGGSSSQVVGAGPHAPPH